MNNRSLLTSNDLALYKSISKSAITNFFEHNHFPKILIQDDISPNWHYDKELIQKLYGVEGLGQ